jgi:serine/threonine protein kinase
VKGKLGYMAPEQVRSARPRPALSTSTRRAVVLWELLANQPLFRGDSDAAVLAQIIAGPAKHPNEVHPDLPQGIDATCMKALATDRDQRFPSAGAFADALEQAAHEARVPIASPRAVAAWIKKLGVHETAPATGTALAEGELPRQPVGRQRPLRSSTPRRSTLPRAARARPA